MTLDETITRATAMFNEMAERANREHLGKLREIGVPKVLLEIAAEQLAVKTNFERATLIESLRRGGEPVTTPLH